MVSRMFAYCQTLVIDFDNEVSFRFKFLLAVIGTYHQLST